MIMSYNQCLDKYKNDYNIKKALAKKEIYKIEKGIYSEQKHVSELEVISLKYPGAVLTINSAFYYHSLTDVVPKYYFLSTDKAGAKIRDKRVKQIFENKELLEIGAIEKEYQNVSIRIYDKERMLIELIRNKNKLPYDYYKEIIGNYRKMIYELDVERIQEYADIFPKRKMISEVLQTEVF